MLLKSKTIYMLGVHDLELWNFLSSSERHYIELTYSAFWLDNAVSVNKYLISHTFHTLAMVLVREEVICVSIICRNLNCICCQLGVVCPKLPFLPNACSINTLFVSLNNMEPPWFIFSLLRVLSSFHAPSHPSLFKWYESSKELTTSVCYAYRGQPPLSPAIVHHEQQY